VRGKELMDTTIRAGWAGFGTKAVYNAMQECDLLLMICTDYPYSNFLPAKGTVIQIDERAEVLGRRTPRALGVIGSARPTMQLLLDKVAATRYSGTTSPANVTDGMRCWTSRATSSGAKTVSIRRRWRAVPSFMFSWPNNRQREHRSVGFLRVRTAPRSE
jgi:thiamine pyrophosphate-dependent acetolactate synthase large subunit-like protein